MDSQLKSSAEEIKIQAVIIKADGSVVELGTIDYWHKNIFKLILWKVKKWLQF